MPTKQQLILGELDLGHLSAAARGAQDGVVQDAALIQIHVLIVVCIVFFEIFARIRAGRVQGSVERPETDVYPSVEAKVRRYITLVLDTSK